VAEHPVQRGVAELDSGASEDDHVRFRIVLVDEVDPGEVRADVAAVEQQASRAGAVLGKVGRGEGRER
jgi:acyl-CoA synthetase (NDP forming)